MLVTLRTIRQMTKDTKELTSLKNTCKDVIAKQHIQEQIDCNNLVVTKLKQHAQDFINAQHPDIRVAIELYFFKGKSWTMVSNTLKGQIHTADSLRIGITRACNSWDTRSI